MNENTLCMRYYIVQLWCHLFSLKCSFSLVVNKFIFILRFSEAEKAFGEALESVQWSNQSSDKKSEISQDLKKQKLEAQNACNLNNNKINHLSGRFIHGIIFLNCLLSGLAYYASSFRFLEFRKIHQKKRIAFLRYYL